MLGATGLLLDFAGCASDPTDAPAGDAGLLGLDSAAPARDGSTGADASTSTDAGVDAADAAPRTYSIKVTVAGLAAATGDAGLDDAGTGGLVLKNGSDALTVLQNGVHTFATKVASGGSFAVTVEAQPTNPAHACTVSGGTGTVVSGDVATITVNCSHSSFTVGGNVGGLAGSGLELRINDTENVPINIVAGTFAFPTPLPSGTPYEVVVLSDPTNRWQTCTLANAMGVVDDANVTDVDVTCTTNAYTISGTISGLTTTGLSLVNTYGGGGGPETINPAANATTFAFAQSVKSGETYAVTVGTQPAGAACTVSAKGSATMAGANVPDVAVTCEASEYDFVFTGAEQSFVVPAWAKSIDVTLEGAQGGTDFQTSANYGGKLTATLAVTPPQTLSIFVGAQPSDASGGFNGGGAGDNGGRGGGGATDIRRGGNTLADRILVAGGGGGAGFWATSNLEVVGGKGGGLSGDNGYRVPDYATNPGGQGGTQTSSGTGTCVSFDNPTVSGGLGFGGTTAGKGCGCQGYGGGGGFYGGSGSGNCRGGGGGSAFALVTADITNVVHTVGGAQPGNGRAHLVAKP